MDFMSFIQLKRQNSFQILTWIRFGASVLLQPRKCIILAYLRESNYKICHYRYLVVNLVEWAELYHDLSNGIDNSPLEPFRQRKSVGCELTFEKDTCNTEEIYSLLNYFARNLEERLEKADFRGHTFTLKVKFHDFKQITRSLSCSCPYLYREEILSVAKEILKSIPYEANPIRLLGVCISNSIYKPKSYPNEYLQLTLDF